MKLNHINLVVSDVAKTRAFFETQFGMRCVAEKGAETFVWLTNDEHFVLAISNFDKVKAIEYPEGFHIGFPPG